MKHKPGGGISGTEPNVLVHASNLALLKWRQEDSEFKPFVNYSMSSRLVHADSQDSPKSNQ